MKPYPSIRLTPDGELMSKLPIHPVLCRMLLDSFTYGCPFSVSM